MNNYYSEVLEKSYSTLEELNDEMEAMYDDRLNYNNSVELMEEFWEEYGIVEGSVCDNIWL